MTSLTVLAGRHLVSPRRGPGVCTECFNLTRGYGLCFACAAGERRLDAMVPISYSVGHEVLHQGIATYKRFADPSVPDAQTWLAAILQAFLPRHERCLAAAAGVTGFDLVTTVPSGEPGRDDHHPLRKIVGEMVPATRARHRRLLMPGAAHPAGRRFDPDRFIVPRHLRGARILLIDDMWTSGASAQSAAAALQAAGARCVAAVVIGRHLNREWHENDLRVARLRTGFDFGVCALCAEAQQAQAA